MKSEWKKGNFSLYKDAFQPFKFRDLWTLVSCMQTEQLGSTVYKIEVSQTKDFACIPSLSQQLTVVKHLIIWEILGCMWVLPAHDCSSHRRVSWQRVGISVAAAVVSAGTTSTWYSVTWLMGSSITGIASGMALQRGGTGLWVSVRQSCSFGAAGRDVRHSECWKTFPSEWRQPGHSLDLCIGKLFARFVFQPHLSCFRPFVIGSSCFGALQTCTQEPAHCQCGDFALSVLAVKLCLHSQLYQWPSCPLKDVFCDFLTHRCRECWNVLLPGSYKAGPEPGTFICTSHQQPDSVQISGLSSTQNKPESTPTPTSARAFQKAAEPKKQEQVLKKPSQEGLANSTKPSVSSSGSSGFRSLNTPWSSSAVNKSDDCKGIPLGNKTDHHEGTTSGPLWTTSKTKTQQARENFFQSLESSSNKTSDAKNHDPSHSSGKKSSGRTATEVTLVKTEKAQARNNIIQALAGSNTSPSRPGGLSSTGSSASSR